MFTGPPEPISASRAAAASSSRCSLEEEVNGGLVGVAIEESPAELGPFRLDPPTAFVRLLSLDLRLGVVVEGEVVEMGVELVVVTKSKTLTVSLSETLAIVTTASPFALVVTIVEPISTISPSPSLVVVADVVVVACVNRNALFFLSLRRLAFSFKVYVK